MTCRVSANPEGNGPTTLELNADVLAVREWDQRGESALEVEAAASSEKPPRYS